MDEQLLAACFVAYRVLHCYSPGEISVVVDLSTDLLSVSKMTVSILILGSSAKSIRSIHKNYILITFIYEMV